MENHSLYSQLFGTQTLPHLLKQQFTPNSEQIQFAKASLIQKHKAAIGIQHILLCRNSKQPQQELLTMNQKIMMENEKKKYIDFVRKNYNQKITEELTSLNKLKTRIREFQNKNQEQKRQDQEEKDGKNLAQQQLNKKRRKNQEIKATTGKKKVKTEEQPKKARKEKKSKEVKGAMKEEVDLPGPEVMNNCDDNEKIVAEPQNLDSESLQLDLLNSLSQDDLDNYQDDQ